MHIQAVMTWVDADDMLARESDLIREHQPLLNVAGKRDSGA
jgi:hypothetical protein